MTIGLVGRKRGMTRIFTEEGSSIPVTVVEVSPNRITQIRSLESDGYAAIQVTCGARRTSLVKRPAAGHFAKAGVEAGEGLWEFRLDDGEGADLSIGSEITVERFEAGQKVDVAGAELVEQLGPAGMGEHRGHRAAIGPRRAFAAFVDGRFLGHVLGHGGLLF